MERSGGESMIREESEWRGENWAEKRAKEGGDNANEAEEGERISDRENE